MKTRSKATNLVRRLSSQHPAGRRCGQWGLPIAEAVLLILAAGSVVFVVARDMFEDTQPLPTSTATLSLPPERALAGRTLCMTSSVEMMPIPSLTCIRES